MITKAIEIRDRATFIPALAVMMEPHEPRYLEEKYLLARAGFHNARCVILCRMEASGCDRNATYDPWAWGSGTRTMTVAHQYIEEHFDELESGCVVDVEFILGETKEPKKSERLA